MPMAAPAPLRFASIAMGLGLALAVTTGAVLALQALRSPSWSRSLWQTLGLGPSVSWPPPGTALSKTVSATPILGFPGWSSSSIVGFVSAVASMEMERGFLQAELGSPMGLPILTSHNLTQYSLLVPTLSLATSSETRALLTLPAGGLAAGELDGVIEIWPDARSVQSGGAPPWKLWSPNASGSVETLVWLPDGGIAAGTGIDGSENDSGVVELWPNASSWQHGDPPVSSLVASSSVYALLSLPGGGIAAGTDIGNIDLWPNASSVEQGGTPVWSLAGPSGSDAAVHALLLLPDDGIAAGTSEGVWVWPNASSVEQGGEAPLTLDASGRVTSLLSLPGGGIAAGTESHTVDLWPNSSLVQQGGPAVTKLQASGQVYALLPLPDGGIAAGTGSNNVRTVDLWPTASSLEEGGPPVKSLQATGSVNALSLLPGGGIGAGTSVNTVDLWPKASSVQRGGPLVPSLQTSDEVRSLFSLPEGGIAAGGDFGINLWPNRSSVRQGGRPVLSLFIDGSSYAALSLPGGGIASGGDLNYVSLWPNASSLQQDAEAPLTLQASGTVYALLLLPDGGIAAGTDATTVDVWPDNSTFPQSAGPSWSLQASGKVDSLLLLPAGGIAAGTDAMTVDMWPDNSSVQEGGAPSWTLTATGRVHSLLSLPGGGIAAGTSALTVDVWPNASSVQQGGLPARSLQPSGKVYALLLLPGGGIVAGTDVGSIDVWPDSASVQQGAVPVRSLQATGEVRALLSLGGVGIAAGGGITAPGGPGGRVDLWPDSSSFRDGRLVHDRRHEEGSGAVTPAGLVVTAFHLETLVALGVVSTAGRTVVELWSTTGALKATLFTEGVATAAALLQTGHLVIATDSAKMGIWAPTGDSSWHPNPVVSFAATGPVQCLVPLPDGGFAAISAAGQEGILELWNFTCALASQPPHRSLKLPAAPAALLWWEEGFVLGSSNGAEFRPMANLSAPVALNVSGVVTSLKALPGSGLAVAVSSQNQVCIWTTSGPALQGSAPDVIFSTIATVASMAILADGTFVAGGVAFFASPCSAGTYSADGLACRLCPTGWLSRTGASSCQFPDLPSTFQSFGLFAGLLLVGLALSHGLTHLPRHAAEQLASGKQLLAAAGSLCSIVGGLALLLAAWSPSTAVLLTCAALGSLLLVPGATAQTEAQLVALALLLLAGFQALQSLLSPEGQPVFTVAGAVDFKKSFWGLMIVAIGLSLAFVAYAIPRVKSFQGGRLLPPPEEHPRAVIALQPLQPTFDMEVESVSSRGCLPPWMSRTKQAALRLAGSFAGEHLLSFAISTFTVAQMSWQLSSRQKGDVGATLVVVSVLLAAIQGFISGTAILTTLGLLPRCLRNATAVILDRHFRLALALKKLALAMKLLVLTLPFPVEIDQPYLWQECLNPASCPSSCTNGPNQRDGTCGTIVSSENGVVTGACTCSALESNFKWVMINVGFSIGVSLCFTLMAIPTYWRAENYLRTISYPRRKLVAQTVLALVPAVIQMLYVYLISRAQECLAMADVAIIIYPSMALELMASEVKRALHGWSGQRRYSTVRSDHLLMTLRPFAVVLSSMAAALCMARAAGVSSTWPSSTVDCSGGSSVWTIISLSLFAGALAAATMGPVASPETVVSENDPVTD